MMRLHSAANNADLLGKRVFYFFGRSFTLFLKHFKEEIVLLTINVPLILKVRDFMFFSRDFFDVEIAPRFAQDNLDVKKVSSPSKTPRNG
jgi:hypothetical protein